MQATTTIARGVPTTVGSYTIELPNVLDCYLIYDATGTAVAKVATEKEARDWVAAANTDAAGYPTSHGHVGFYRSDYGDVEYFIRNDSIYRAPIFYPVQTDGYRAGRWQWPGEYGLKHLAKHWSDRRL